MWSLPLQLLPCVVVVAEHCDSRLGYRLQILIRFHWLSCRLSSVQQTATSNRIVSNRILLLLRHRSCHLRLRHQQVMQTLSNTLLMSTREIAVHRGFPSGASSVANASQARMDCDATWWTGTTCRRAFDASFARKRSGIDEPFEGTSSPVTQTPSPDRSLAYPSGSALVSKLCPALNS